MFVCVYVVCSYCACVPQWSCMVSGQVERLRSLNWSYGSWVGILLRSSNLISASDPLWWPRKSHYSQHNAYHKKTTCSLIISALIFRFHLCFMTKDSFCLSLAHSVEQSTLQNVQFYLTRVLSLIFKEISTI